MKSYINFDTVLMCVMCCKVEWVQWKYHQWLMRHAPWLVETSSSSLKELALRPPQNMSTSDTRLSYLLSTLCPESTVVCWILCSASRWFRNPSLSTANCYVSM